MDRDVTICYDMSIREFKRSTIHDLFMVLFIYFYNFIIFFWSIITCEMFELYFSFHLTSMFFNVGHV